MLQSIMVLILVNNTQTIDCTKYSDSLPVSPLSNMHWLVRIYIYILFNAQLILTKV